jgi:hypothetical protein
MEAKTNTFAAVLCRLPLWAVVCFLAISAPALALSEFFETYNAPQALAMGNAFTADAVGVNALFYNPAGLAKAEIKGWAVTPVAIDGVFSGGFLSNSMAAKTLWADRLLQNLTPGTYNYFRGTAMPSFTRRNFGIALIGNYEFAALSDGTTIDMNYHKDFGVVVGGATNLYANMVKIGFSLKALDRSEMVGSYAVSSLPPTDTTSHLMKEGIGFGADMGIMLTLPTSYLPTIGLAWKDMLIGTPFLPASFFNDTPAGVPQSIAQSFNLAASIHPILWRGARAIFSAEIRHIERMDLPLTKRLHFGFQYVAHKQFFIWAGLSQMCPTGGVGLRLPGGDFEIGSYAQDIGAGTVVTADRRFMIRYTIGF